MRLEETSRMSLGSQSNQGKPSIPNYVQLDTHLENCWICENWVETQYRINLIDMMKQKFDIDVEMVDDTETRYHFFIHFDFDKYDPDRLDDLRSSGQKGWF